MMRTYKAILKDDHLEWAGEVPAVAGAVTVHVTVLQEEPGDSGATERNKAAVEALRQLAAINAFAEIPDPVAWQREIRKDRPLPGRET